MPELVSFRDVASAGDPIGLIGDIPDSAPLSRITLQIQQPVAAFDYIQGALALPSGSVVLFEIESDFACRVRFYTTAADRDSDFSRSAAIDPGAGEGVLAEFILSPNDIIQTGPPPILANGDIPLLPRTYYTVENLSGANLNQLTIKLQVASLE